MYNSTYIQYVLYRRSSMPGFWFPQVLFACFPYFAFYLFYIYTCFVSRIVRKMCALCFDAWYF